MFCLLHDCTYHTLHRNQHRTTHQHRKIFQPASSFKFSTTNPPFCHKNNQSNKYLSILAIIIYIHWLSSSTLFMSLYLSLARHSKLYSHPTFAGCNLWSLNLAETHCPQFEGSKRSCAVLVRHLCPSHDCWNPSLAHRWTQSSTHILATLATWSVYVQVADQMAVPNDSPRGWLDARLEYIPYLLLFWPAPL